MVRSYRRSARVRRRGMRINLRQFFESIKLMARFLLPLREKVSSR